MCWQELININRQHFDDSETKLNHEGIHIEIIEVLSIKNFLGHFLMTKRYIFGWMEQTLLLRRSDQGSGKGNEAEMIGCQWLVHRLRSVTVSYTIVTVLVLVCYSVNTTWQGAIKLDRHQSIFFKTQKQSVCRKATSRYLHAFESFVNKNCDA